MAGAPTPLARRGRHPPWIPRMSRLQGARHFGHFEHLEDVAHDDVVVVLQRQAALQAGANFLRIVLESLERIDLAGPDDDVVAQQAHRRRALDDAIGDQATGNRADLRDQDDLADFDLADDGFAPFRSQHARQCRLDLFDRIINDVVVADVDTVGFGQLAGLAVGTGVEADDDRFRGHRQVDVRFRDATDGGVHDLHTHFRRRQLLQRADQGFLRTLHVRLDDQRQVLHFAFGHLVEHVLQLGGLLLGQFHVAELTLTEQTDLAGLAFVGHDHDFLAGSRHFRQALDFDRDRWTGFGHRLAILVQHGAHAAIRGTRQHDVAALQGTGLHQDRRNRAAALVQTGFDHQATGRSFHRRLQFQHFGLQQHVFQQGIDALAGLRRHRHEWRFATVFFRHDAFGNQFLRHAVDVAARLVDLVDGDNQGYAGRFRVGDRFLRLRHHAVVRRHHEDDDVRCLRTAGTHCREGLVTWRIQEGDHAAWRID